MLNENDLTDEQLGEVDTDLPPVDLRVISKVADPADPTRCKTATQDGQCLNKAVPGCNNCMIHGGAGQLVAQAGVGLKNYRLSKFQAQVARMGNSDGVKSLRDEIGILRMIMEEQLNRCEDASDLMIASHTITDLVLKIEKVVVSCTKLESSLGQTMDKQALLNFASQVIGIIGNHVTDSETLDAISDNILKALSSTETE